MQWDHLSDTGIGSAEGGAQRRGVVELLASATHVKIGIAETRGGFRHCPRVANDLFMPKEPPIKLRVQVHHDSKESGMTTETRIVLITGGSRGLGREAALEVAKQGDDVLLTYHSRADAAQSVVADIEAMGRKAVALQLDVAASDRFAAFADTVRDTLQSTWDRTRFDALLNNAGHGLNRPFAKTTETEFDSIMQVHVKAPFFLTQALLPLLADHGRILNVSSGLARFSLPGHAAYASAKGAIEVLSRYLAKELGDRGISVNAIAPGAIETDFGGGAVRDNEAINQQVASVTAMGRAGQPSDIGVIMAQLLGPGSCWITGQRIEASGGMLL